MKLSNIKNNNQRNHILKIIAFTTTGLISLIFNYTAASSVIDYIIATMLTIVLQSITIIFYVVGHKHADDPLYAKFKRWSYYFFMLSILATISLSYNQINILYNDWMAKSEQYQQKLQINEDLNTAKEVLSNSIKNNGEGAEIEKQPYYNNIEIIKQEIAGYETRIEDWKSLEKKENQLYYGQINKEKAKIADANKRIAEQNELIAAVSKKYLDKKMANEDRLTNLLTGAETIDNSITLSKNESENYIEFRATKGFLGLAQFLEDLIKGKITWVQLFAMIISSMVGIGLERGAVLLFLLCDMENDETNQDPTPGGKKRYKFKEKAIKSIKDLSLNGENKNNTVTAIKEPINEIEIKRNKKALGLNDLKSKPKDIKFEDINKYIDYMYKTATKDTNGNLVSVGYQKIAREIKITQDRGRKIKNWLENEGVVVCKNRKTIIKKKLERVS